MHNLKATLLVVALSTSCVTPLPELIAADRSDMGKYSGATKTEVERFDRSVARCVSSANEARLDHNDYSGRSGLWEKGTAIMGVLAGATGTTLALVAQMNNDENTKAVVTATAGAIVAFAGIGTTASLAVMHATGLPDVQAASEARYALFREKHRDSEAQFAKLDEELRSDDTDRRDAATDMLTSLSAAVERSCRELSAE